MAKLSLALAAKLFAILAVFGFLPFRHNEVSAGGGRTQELEILLIRNVVRSV